MDVAQLYTNDNWEIRRRWLQRLIIWKVFFASVIMVWAMATNSENALLQIALPSLLAAIAAEASAYVFGSVQDDRDKRDKLPRFRATHEEELTLQPPEGFAQ